MVEAARRAIIAERARVLLDVEQAELQRRGRDTAPHRCCSYDAREQTRHGVCDLRHTKCTAPLNLPPLQLGESIVAS